MSVTVYYTAVSLDGFIADAKHSLDWLFRQELDEAGPMNHEELLARVGAVVMGFTTYEWILTHEHGVWPYRLPTWVMTSRDLPKVAGEVRFARGDVRAVHGAMTDAAAGKDLWVVGGGDVAGQFADAGLLDEIVVAVAPVTLGAGAPLLPRRLDLRLEELAQNAAFVCARYTVLAATTPPRVQAHT